MSDGTPGFFASVWRFISFYKIRKALGIARAADRQFTGSAAGISDAYDITHDTLVHDFNELMAAVTQVATAIEQKRGQKAKIEENLATENKALDGALNAVVKRETAGNTAGATEAKADAARFKANVDRMTGQIAAIDADIAGNEPQLTQLKRRLTDMQTKIGNLSTDKANAISQYVSDKAIIDANKRLMGLKTSGDRAPIDAVEKMLAEQKAAAQVSGEIAGTDASDKRNTYLEESASASASDSIEAMLAARREAAAVKDGKVAPKTDDREKI